MFKAFIATFYSIPAKGLICQNYFIQLVPKLKIYTTIIIPFTNQIRTRARTLQITTRTTNTSDLCNNIQTIQINIKCLTLLTK